MQKGGDILEWVKMIAPGTPLREGLDNIIRAKTGALIVIGDSPQIMDIIDGGFYIDCEYAPPYLYELAKMDGGIILSCNAKRILYANTQLIPDPSIFSTETGIRHRTAERVARQTGDTVISISQRRNVITLYRGFSKYVVRDSAALISKANQATQTLEKYKIVLDRAKINLTALEYEDMVTLSDVVTVIQKTEMVMRIAAEVEEYLIELGSEGRLIGLQLEELVADVKKDGIHIIMDYCPEGQGISCQDIDKTLRKLPPSEIMNAARIGGILGYREDMELLQTPVYPKGYRLLNKIPRLPGPVIENLVRKFKRFGSIVTASADQLDEVEGIGEVRVHAINEGLKRIREQAVNDRVT
jgi:diadenylate cyclase